MSLFQEIAFNEDVSVIHARRKDGVVVIATRVPLIYYTHKNLDHLILQILSTAK
jgi:hypothetical protein